MYFSLRIAKGVFPENSFVTLLGPSGCGKTTLLRILGGFLEQDEGSVYLDGEEISAVPAYKRPINTVFIYKKHKVSVYFYGTINRIFVIFK